jgi:tetratricopeptide (TPR) repeat protein
MGHYYLALAHMGNKDIQQAKTELAEAVKLNPRYIEARLVLADLQAKSGAQDLAIEQAQEILKLNPQVTQAQMIMANAYLAKKDLPKATKTAEAMIQGAPNNPVGYYELGRVFLLQKKDKEAQAQLEKALSLQPNFLEALNLLVGIDVSRKDYKKAL